MALRLLVPWSSKPALVLRIRYTLALIIRYALVLMNRYRWVTPRGDIRRDWISGSIAGHPIGSGPAPRFRCYCRG
jgi:hypothetical protein